MHMAHLLLDQREGLAFSSKDDYNEDQNSVFPSRVLNCPNLKQTQWLGDQEDRPGLPERDCEPIPHSIPHPGCDVGCMALGLSCGKLQ